MAQHYQQIDVVKGLAIISVILLHSLELGFRQSTYAAFHIGQAVPLFLILMGLNLGLATNGRRQAFSALYTRLYFERRVDRLLVPLLLVYLASFLAGVAWLWITQQNKININGYSLIGLLPVSGPGNYFVTLVLQSILLLPLIGYFFQRQPVLTVLLLVAGEVLFLLLSNSVRLFDENNYLYSAALPRYFSAIAGGLILSRLVVRPLRARTLALLLLLALGSAAYLFEVVYLNLQVPGIRADWDTQNLLAFGYAASLLLLLFKLLPQRSNKGALRFLAALGKASYHIFLVQVVYFGLVTLPQSQVLFNLACCLLLGYLFYRYDEPLKEKIVYLRRERG
ncbi:MAG: acyltransferase family protein [Adhaeribacter sp.]